MNAPELLNKDVPLKIFIKISGDAEITKLNTKYFGREYSTDVLSFSIQEKDADGSVHLGDIIVNKDQAVRQSKEYTNDLAHEISELVAHGVLHLLGVHHKGDDDESVHGVEIK